jgi:hypothetical protein
MLKKVFKSKLDNVQVDEENYGITSFICGIYGFHNGGYEDYCDLGYKAI